MTMLALLRGTMVRIFSLLAETVPLPLAAQDQAVCQVSTPVSFNI